MDATWALHSEQIFSYKGFSSGAFGLTELHRQEGRPGRSVPSLFLFHGGYMLL